MWKKCKPKLVCFLSTDVTVSLSLFSTYFTINDCPSFHFQTKYKVNKRGK